MSGMRKRMVRLVVGLAVVGIGGVWLQTAVSSPRLPGPSAPDGSAIHALGHVDVESGAAKLAPARPGRVIELPVREGQVVEDGTVLVRLDDTQARARLREAEAALAEATRAWEAARSLPAQHKAKVAAQAAAVEGARARLAGAERVAKELARQVTPMGTVVREYDAAVAADQVAGERAALAAEEARLAGLQAADPAPEVARAEAAVGVRRAQVEQAREDVAGHVLRAPGRGTVLRLLTRAGEAVAGQPVVAFGPAGPRVVRVELEPEAAGRVRVGCPAVLEADDGSGRTWWGRVTRLADWYAPRRQQWHDSLPHNDLKTLECVVEPEADLPLRLNQPVRVRLVPAER